MRSTYVLTLTLEASTRADLALLDELRKEFPDLSRARLKEVFKQGGVQWNKNDQKIKPAEQLQIGTHVIKVSGIQEDTFTSPLARVAPESFRLPCVYEDDLCFVLSKPAGVPSIPLSNTENKTAISAALGFYPELSSVKPGGLEPGILHRLDTGTSGLLCFAKSDAEYDRLRAAWKSGGVKKIYRAIVRIAEGKPIPIAQILTSPLEHDPKSSKRMRIADDLADGLPAITEILKVQKLGAVLFDLEIEIKTGVMHQIRAHLSSAGWPILGDHIYSGAPSRRMWLHAWKLELPRADQSRISVMSDLPEGWPKA